MQTTRYYTIRVDDVETINVFQAIEAFFDDHNMIGIIKDAVVSFEIAEKTKKPHYQGYFGVTAETEDQWVRNRFRARFGKLAKHQKSCAVMKKESYKSYILKQNDIRIKRNITDEEIAEIPQWEESKKDSKERKATRRDTFYDDFKEYIKSQNDYKDHVHCRHWVAGQLVDFLGSHQKPEVLPWLRGVVFSVQCTFLPHMLDKKRDRARELLVNTLIDF